MKTLFILLFAYTVAFCGNPNDMKNYIEKSGKEPSQYVIEKFKDKDIVVFSKMHKLKHESDFLKDLLPNLGKSGITNLALEIGNTNDQSRLNKLLSDKEFNRDLVIEILRNDNSYGFYGYEEYIDLFKLVWELKNAPYNYNFNVILLGNSNPKVDLPKKTLVILTKGKKTDYANSFIVSFHTAQQKDMNEVYDILSTKNPVAIDLSSSPVKSENEGYIFLKSPKEFEPLTWISDFVDDNYFQKVKIYFKHLQVDTKDYASEVCKSFDWTNFEIAKGNVSEK